MSLIKHGAHEKKASKAGIYLLLWAVVSLGCFLVLRYVYPMGDDLLYGTWGKLGFQELIDRMRQHYHSANGRTIVHFLDCLLLRSDKTLRFARVFIAMLCGFVAAGTARLSNPGNTELPVICVICGSGIFLLSNVLTRQSLYWISGAMNYVFPLAFFILYWLCLRRSLGTGKLWLVTSVMAFLSGAATEQIGMMTVGVTVLAFDEHRLKYKRFPLKKALPVLSLAAVGMASVIFAPSVRYRLNLTVPPVEGGTLALVKYNLLGLRYNFLFGETLFPLHMTVMTAMPLYLSALTLKEHRIPDMVFTVISFLVFISWFFLPQYEPLTPVYGRYYPPYLDPLALFILAGYLIVMLYTSVRAMLQGDSTPFYAVILGVGSQVMMLVSPTSGPRTMLCFVVMMLLFTSCIIRDAPYLYVLMMGAWLAWHWGQALAFWTVLIAAVLWLFKKYKFICKALACLCCVPLLFCGIHMQIKTMNGYRGNAEIHKANIEMIASYKGKGPITLKKTPAEAYGWVMPYLNEYYAPYFNIYYGLPQFTKQIWS